MRNVTNFFLANLAISDLCVGIFCVLPTLSIYLSPYWILGEVSVHGYIHSPQLIWAHPYHKNMSCCNTGSGGHKIKISTKSSLKVFISMYFFYLKFKSHLNIWWEYMLDCAPILTSYCTVLDFIHEYLFQNKNKTNPSE